MDEAGTEEHVAVVEELFGAWLNASRLHGCGFAAWAAKAGRILFASFFDPPSDDVVRQLSHHIQIATSRSQLALATFPSIATERGLGDLIRLLLKDPRWTMERLDVPHRLAIDLRWRATPTSEASSAIGFAPLGTMPVTRRAPYVAIGIWAHGRDNPRRKRQDPFVGVGDMAHDLEAAQYDGLFRSTRERVSRTRSVLGDRSVATGVTFCLSDPGADAV